MRKAIVLAMWLGLSGPGVAAETTTILSVPGIACQSCVGAGGGALRDVAGVAAVRVDLAHKRVVVRYDPQRVGVAALLNAIDTVGFTASVVPPVPHGGT